MFTCFFFSFKVYAPSFKDIEKIQETAILFYIFREWGPISNLNAIKIK